MKCNQAILRLKSSVCPSSVVNKGGLSEGLSSGVKWRLHRCGRVASEKGEFYLKLKDNEKIFMHGKRQTHLVYIFRSFERNQCLTERKIFLLVALTLQNRLFDGTQVLWQRMRICSLFFSFLFSPVFLFSTIHCKHTFQSRLIFLTCLENLFPNQFFASSVIFLLHTR